MTPASSFGSEMSVHSTWVCFQNAPSCLHQSGLWLVSPPSMFDQSFSILPGPGRTWARPSALQKGRASRMVSSTLEELLAGSTGIHTG